MTSPDVSNLRGERVGGEGILTGILAKLGPGLFDRANIAVIWNEDQEMRPSESGDSRYAMTHSLRESGCHSRRYGRNRAFPFEGAKRIIKNLLVTNFDILRILSYITVGSQISKITVHRLQCSRIIASGFYSRRILFGVTAKAGPRPSHVHPEPRKCHEARKCHNCRTKRLKNREQGGYAPIYHGLQKRKASWIVVWSVMRRFL